MSSFNNTNQLTQQISGLSLSAPIPNRDGHSPLLFNANQPNGFILLNRIYFEKIII